MGYITKSRQGHAGKNKDINIYMKAVNIMTMTVGLPEQAVAVLFYINNLFILRITTDVTYSERRYKNQNLVYKNQSNFSRNACQENLGCELRQIKY